MGHQWLYITQSKGCKHSVLPESEKVMQELAAQHGFEVTVSQEAEQSLTQENLKNFDVVMFYTTGELSLSAEQQAAFLNFIKSGTAFIGVHSATDTFYQWPEYGEMIGGYFAAHPRGKFEATIKVDNRQHPATRHLPETFKLDDEIYTFKEFRPDLVKVLMHLDTTGLDLTQKGLENVNAKNYPGESVTVRFANQSKKAIAVRYCSRGRTAAGIKYIAPFKCIRYAKGNTVCTALDGLPSLTIPCQRLQLTLN